MAGRDVVLPPNYRLKNGPRHNRCSTAKAGGKAGGKSGGKGGGKGSGLGSSPWRPLLSLSERPYTATWAGLASGRGLGFRNGGPEYALGGMGSGPRVRVWLSRLADNGSLPGLFVTDTASAAHLRRNARTLPPCVAEARTLRPRLRVCIAHRACHRACHHTCHHAPHRLAPPRSLLRSPRALDGQRGYGHLLGSGDKLGLACLSPYGGNNGWEGRSAEALRRRTATLPTPACTH